jgi:hypothetical protein
MSEDVGISAWLPVAFVVRPGYPVCDLIDERILANIAANCAKLVQNFLLIGFVATAITFADGLKYARHSCFPIVLTLVAFGYTQYEVSTLF